MWRREKELGYWLSGRQTSEKPGFVLKLKGKIPQKLGLSQFHNIVKEQSLILDTRAKSFDGELTVAANVIDGLSDICQWTHYELPHEIREKQTSIHDTDLMEEAEVQELKLQNMHDIRVQEGKIALVAHARLMQVKLRTARVKNLECLKSRTVAVNDGVQMIWINPKIRGQMSNIAPLTHKRESLEMDDLTQQEKESFLYEAQALKHVPVEQTEVIAVFRNVPIEMISRLRFLEDKRMIQYTISKSPHRSQTRVHDMAAIRDNTNKEIHLVPHRARYRIVSLN